MLTKVVRPDGAPVEFTYDALGRRLSKTYLNCKTHWIWDGNVPLHEWVELQAAPSGEAAPPLPTAVTDEIAAKQRRANLNERPAQGPPDAPTSPAPSLPAWVVTPPSAAQVGHPPTASTSTAPATATSAEHGTAESPITWLFEPESFAPLAKLVGDSRYGIVTDHLGTPQAMFDATGAEVWSASIDAYGDLRNIKGPRQSCPFRFPGQYEDEETGLYYNRFRYYDPRSGQYQTQDPIRIYGGIGLYAYAGDPTRQMDLFGLTCASEFETEPDTAFFWSGRTNGKGGELLAMHIAEARGGTTLEMLMQKRGISLPPFDKTNPAVIAIWQDASRTYAEGVKGHVRAVIGEDLRPGNVWQGSEYDALVKNPKVTKLTIIDPSTGAERVAFER